MPALPPTEHAASNALQQRPGTPATATPAFRLWFGHSIVVDASGQPLMVFRGTTRPDTATSFRTKKTLPSFTGSPDVASVYASTDLDTVPEYRGGAIVGAYYLSIQKPLDFRSGYEGTHNLSFSLYDLTSDLSNDVMEDEAGFDFLVRMLRELQARHEHGATFQVRFDRQGIIDWDAFIRALMRAKQRDDSDRFMQLLDGFELDIYAVADTQAYLQWAMTKGFDGFVYDDVFGARGQEAALRLLGKSPGHSHVTYRPFHQHQIKSVFNQGTWDASAAHVSEQMRPESLLCESPTVQRGLETIARICIQELAQRTCQQISGAIAHRGSADQLDWWDLSGVLVQFDKLQVRALPLALRPFVKKCALSIKVRYGRQAYADYEACGRNSAEMTLFFDKAIAVFVEMADDSIMMTKFLMQRHSNLVHELTHAFDNWQSKGKFTKNARSQLAKASIKRAMSTGDEVDQQKAGQDYVNDPAEINAHFQQIVAELRGLGIEDWPRYLDEFKSSFPGWQILTSGVKQRLIRRLAMEWSNSGKMRAMSESVVRPAAMTRKQIDAYTDIWSMMVKKYGQPVGVGRHRAVFGNGRFVFKVPINPAGFEDNQREARLYRTGTPNVALAKCRLIKMKAIPILVMEFVMEIHHLDQPDWAQFIDKAQVGRNRSGKAVAYDFADL